MPRKAGCQDATGIVLLGQEQSKSRLSGGTHQMNAEQMVNKLREARAAFGPTCLKFVGAMTIEVLREALLEEGIPTSPRDVFIRGIPVEIDLVVPRPQQQPTMGLLYEPNQVAAVLEVKNHGLFGESALSKIKKDFTCCKDKNKGIFCAYVTFEEQCGYRWAATAEKLGFPCFTLAWRKSAGKPLEPTEDWATLVEVLHGGLKAAGDR